MMCVFQSDCGKSNNSVHKFHWQIIHYCRRCFFIVWLICLFSKFIVMFCFSAAQWTLFVCSHHKWTSRNVTFEHSCVQFDTFSDRFFCSLNIFNAICQNDSTLYVTDTVSDESTMRGSVLTFNGISRWELKLCQQFM